jgi:hypothetical protein
LYLSEFKEENRDFAARCKSLKVHETASIALLRQLCSSVRPSNHPTPRRATESNVKHRSSISADPSLIFGGGKSAPIMILLL